MSWIFTQKYNSLYICCLIRQSAQPACQTFEFRQTQVNKQATAPKLLFLSLFYILLYSLKIAIQTHFPVQMPVSLSLTSWTIRGRMVFMVVFYVNRCGRISSVK